ncbi:MAG: carbamate kinase [Acidimicrobiales bacterium]
MRIVAALGGNALLERGEAPDSEIQERHVRHAAEALAPLAHDHDELVITHGNGPQVGILAVESADDPSLSHPYPFDALVAQTQGLIGYWLIQALECAVPGRRVACLVSRTVVDPADPALADPSKFVGPVYSKTQADRLAAAHGWHVRPDGRNWRRVVPSPQPQGIAELDLIRLLLDSGATVICQGGGGVPVARDGRGRFHGVEAVVDKDTTSALLAEQLDADALLLLTDVAAVELDYGSADARPLRRAGVEQLRGIHFAAGSMGPKVAAACRFVERTGGLAAIGRLDDASSLLSGRAGTLVTPAEDRAVSEPTRAAGTRRLGTSAPGRHGGTPP